MNNAEQAEARVFAIIQGVCRENGVRLVRMGASFDDGCSHFGNGYDLMWRVRRYRFAADLILGASVAAFTAGMILAAYRIATLPVSTIYLAQLIAAILIHAISRNLRAPTPKEIERKIDAALAIEGFRSERCGAHQRIYLA